MANKWLKENQSTIRKMRMNYLMSFSANGFLLHSLLNRCTISNHSFQLSAFHSVVCCWIYCDYWVHPADEKKHVLQTNCQSLIEWLLEWTLTSSLKYNLIYMKHKCILLVKCPLYEIYVIIKTFLFSFLSQSWKMLYITVA